MRRTWAPVAALLALAVGVGLGRLATGEAGDARGALPPDLARVPAKGLLLLSVRPADLWSGKLATAARQKLGKDSAELVRSLEEGVGLAPDRIERLTLVQLDANGPGIPLVLIAATEKVDLTAVLKRVLPRGKKTQHRGQTYWADDNTALASLGEKTYVFGSAGDVQNLIATKPGSASGGLADAARLAAKKHSAVLAINPKALPPIPEELPAAVEPFKPLLKARLATATLDVGENTTAQLRVQFEDNQAAAAGQKSLETAQKLLRGVLAGTAKTLVQDKQGKPLAALVEDIDASVGNARLDRDGRDVQGTLRVKVDLGQVGLLALDAVNRIRLAALRTQSANNLKQIGLAMHNYHDTNNAFPPQAVYSKDGKPLLSWRVLILPYIEEDNLYRQFKLDEAWDGPNNKKLITRMPKVYQLPGAKAVAPGQTHYQAFFGKGAIFDGKRGLRLADITDGTSNTVLVAEAAREVTWSKPDDLPCDPKDPLPRLGGVLPGVHQVLFADGSVRALSAKIDARTMRALITRSGGEVIGDF